MIAVRYVGPHDAVEVPRPGGAYDAVVARGEVLHTTAEHAERLLEQPSNWLAVEAAKKSTEKAAAGGKDGK